MSRPGPEHGQNSRLGKLLTLLEQKESRPLDNELETRFYNELLSFLLSSAASDHWWCSDLELPLARESLWLFSLPDHQHISLYKEKLTKQLNTCVHCLRRYHKSKPLLRKRYTKLFSPENVESFFNTLDAFDRHRVMTTLRRWSLQQQQSDDRSFMLSESLICTITDILFSVYLLRDPDCDRLLCAVFDQFQRTNMFPTMTTDTVNGAMILAFHHHRSIRFWARKLLERVLSEGFSSEDDRGLKEIPGWLLESTHETDLIRLTDDMGDRWKAFRVVASLLSAERLSNILRVSRISISQLVQQQLGGSWISEMVKTITVMLEKVKDEFWREDDNQYTFTKRICEHVQFQDAMKIARQDNAGKIKQRDGSAYPEDKLILRIRGLLEWIYMCWKTRKKDHETEVNKGILDLLLGYYQLDTWAMLCRAICAEFAFSIVEELMREDRLPETLFEKYGTVVALFASMSKDDMPATLQNVPDTAVNVASDILRQDIMSLRVRISTLAQTSISDYEAITENTVFHEHLWRAILDACTGVTSVNTRLLLIMLGAYGSVALLDLPVLEASSSALKSGAGIEALRQLNLVQRACTATLSAGINQLELNSVITGENLLNALLRAACSVHRHTQDLVKKLLGDEKQFFRRNVKKVLQVFPSLLIEFNDLSSQKVIGLDILQLVPRLMQVFYRFAFALIGDKEGYLLESVVPGKTFDSEECNLLDQFWNTGWKTLGLLFDKGTKWAEHHKPKELVDAMMPSFDVARLLIGSRQLFQKAIESDASLADVSVSRRRYESVNDAVAPLSHWIYVTRPEVLEKVVPLLTAMMRQVQHGRLKISLDAYIQLMSAATGESTTRLSGSQKEEIFVALSAHEPENDILLDDSSEDENVEWQVINPPPVESKKTTVSSASAAIRQLRLDESFLYAGSRSTDPQLPKTPAAQPEKITSYFGTPAVKQEPASPAMSEEYDELWDEFSDVDFSALPEDWFEGKASENVSECSTSDKSVEPEQPKSPALAKGKSIATAVQQEQFRRKAEESRLQERLQVPRFVPQTTKPTVYAVTSTGRKLKPPPMGFSKMKALREEFKAERRLFATAKSPSAIARKKRTRSNGGSGSSSSEESSEESDDGLKGLVRHLDKKKKNNDNKPTVEEEKAGIRALFESPNKRSIKLIESPATEMFLERRAKLKMAEERRQRVTPDINRLFKTILSWDMTCNTDFPPGACKDIYKEIPDKFPSFNDYLKIFEPLVFLEAWVQIMKARETLSEADVIDNCMLDNRCHVNDYVDASFQVPLNYFSSILVDDLVCVANHFGNEFFRKDELNHVASEPLNKPSTWKGKSFLGKVMSVNHRKNITELVIRCYFPRDRILLLNSLMPKSIWRLLRVISLTTVQREYTALKGLEHYGLARDILQPRTTELPMISDQKVEECMRKYGVNEPQAEAIVGAMTKEEGFTLIQGPPGTGKTKTILGLIVSLLDSKKHKESVRRGLPISSDASMYGGRHKILVCAPSNAAVDEIAKRLKDGIKTASGLAKPKVVRIGTTESVNPSVQDLLLDRLAEKEWESYIQDDEGKTKEFGMRREKLRGDLQKLQLEIEDLGRQISECAPDSEQISVLRKKKSQLVATRMRTKMMLKDISEDQRDYTRELEVSRLRARQRVFAEADIVCSTLSGSGHEMLASLGLSFETVIVDEAAQAVEISTLIPLKYGCKRCVLVGDPNQLPPTVISLMAARYSYEQSLFLRLQKSSPHGVHLLSIQYRMHPDISSFPSKLFYGSRLLDGPDLAKITAAPWHAKQYFPPYCFYNVEDGHEKMGTGKSVYNAAEAEAALALVDMLATRLPQVKFAYRIGIITPYKQQLSQIKSRFERRYGTRILDVIDFNTVDGFQGQEKDIIIFSCVRASSDRGIGFLSDIRRMNVGLTRAKRSMFVLGNKLSLQKSDFWRELVEDAADRGVLVDIRSPYFNHRMIPDYAPANLFEEEIHSEIAPRDQAVNSTSGAQKVAI